MVTVPEGLAAPEPLLRRAVRATLESEGVRTGEFSVALLPDEPILEMNREWLGHDWVPDVLSFALGEDGAPPVGDIYVGLDQAARQAREHHVSIEEELVRLCIHGTLHILGYDHPEGASPDGGAPLFDKQEALVRKVMESEEDAG